MVCDYAAGVPILAGGNDRQVGRAEAFLDPEVALGVLAFQPALAHDQLREIEIHSNHWIHGVPLGTPVTNDLIIRDSYALSSNDQTKFADWVAYRLSPREVAGTVDLDRDWRADPFLNEAETLEPSPRTI